MTTTWRSRFARIWPSSLFARLAFVWLLALGVGHLIQNIYGYMALYDDQIARTDYYFAQDLSVLLPELESASPVERDAWLKKMQRKAYRYELVNMSHRELLDETIAFDPATSPKHSVSNSIQNALAAQYAIRHSDGREPDEMRRFYFVLKDGQVLIAILNRPIWPIDWGSGIVFSLQVFAVLGFTWIAVRQATLPLQKLAEATEALGASLHSEALPEDGPSEVARAAATFNIMQAQIKHHLAERVQILAAISHDLQTPITRMRIRTEMMEVGELREKLQSDLSAMQSLVEEGITFARSSQKNTEQVCRVDLDALLDSLVYDYLDAQQALSLHGHLGDIIQTRPNTLKRLLMNLVDNALKFAVDVELHVRRIDDKHVEISVRDRGPGIPESELQAVFAPFYRIENSRNRGTGGTGLGLAIAQRLAQTLDGKIVLRNREGGGLEANFVFRYQL